MPDATVVVVGGGAAGVAAALGSARRGADVTLLESSGFLGGNSAILPWLGFHSRQYQRVVGGIARELADALRASGDGSDDILDPVCGSAFSFNGHAYRVLLMRVLSEAGVQIRLHSQVVAVRTENRRVAAVQVQQRTDRAWVPADLVIDASGDGEVAALAGATWEKGRTSDGRVQAPTLVFRITGIDRSAFVAHLQNPESRFRDLLDEDPNAYEKLRARLPGQPVIILGGLTKALQDAKDAGILHAPTTRIVGVKTHRPDELVVVSTKVAQFDPLDADSLSAAYVDAYAQIPELLAAFQENLPGFAQARLEEIAPILGVRESRRVIGDYVLSGEDVVSGAVFDDGIGMGAYHIDIHRPDGSWIDSQDALPYDLPMRSLIARDLDNLLVAGKCFSATHEAIASTRVIPICMAQGEAAGALAALSGGDVRSVHASVVQKSLRASGALLRDGLEAADPETIERIGVIAPMSRVG